MRHTRRGARSVDPYPSSPSDSAVSGYITRSDDARPTLSTNQQAHHPPHLGKTDKGLRHRRRSDHRTGNDLFRGVLTLILFTEHRMLNAHEADARGPGETRRASLAGNARTAISEVGAPCDRRELIACHECDLLQHGCDVPPGGALRCCRCRAVLYRCRRHDFDRASPSPLRRVFSGSSRTRFRLSVFRSRAISSKLH